MKMPFWRAVAGAIAGVAMAGFAALADGNHQHASDQRRDGAGRSQDQILPQPDGLPDVSPTPKKDSMGMDYIPVYEGDDSDDGSVKLSPGRIQRSGVKSEPAAMRVIRTTVRAPGTIQLDERRVSVIAMRAESYVQKVDDVTTGSHVVKGQPLMEIYSPAISSAAAEYISTLNSKVTGGDGPYGSGSRQRLINLDVPEAAIAAMEKTPQRADRDRLDVAARRHRSRTQRHRRHARPARRVLFRIADHSVVWAMIDVAERDLGAMAVGPARRRAREEFSRAGFRRQGQRDLSADQSRRRAQRACASNLPIPTGAAAPTCMSMPKSRPAARIPSRRSRKRRDRHRQPAGRAGRQGRRAVRAARGQARPSRRGLCRGPRRPRRG